MWNIPVQSLPFFRDQEDPQEKAVETRSSILIREIPWTENPDGLQSKEWAMTSWLNSNNKHFPPSLSLSPVCIWVCHLILHPIFRWLQILCLSYTFRSQFYSHVDTWWVNEVNFWHIFIAYLYGVMSPAFAVYALEVWDVQVDSPAGTNLPTLEVHLTGYLSPVMCQKNFPSTDSLPQILFCFTSLYLLLFLFLAKSIHLPTF